MSACPALGLSLVVILTLLLHLPTSCVSSNSLLTVSSYRLRKKLHDTTNYGDWVKEAKTLDRFLGNENWKEIDEYAYYDHKTVRRVLEQIKKCRKKVDGGDDSKMSAAEELKGLIEACVKNNFVGVENSRLYSQTYYGTKNLVQEFVDEGMRSLCSLAMCF